MSEIDQQFIEYVVKSLVGNPDAVHIDRRIDEKGVLLELTVDPEDLGRVIGKRGATAQSLRTLLRALGTKNDARYNLKIIDNGVGAPSSSQPADDTSSSPATTDSGSAVADHDDVQPESKEEPAQDEAEATSENNEESAPAEETPEDTEPEDNSSEETSDRLRQTREELADLDDLDV